MSLCLSLPLGASTMQTIQGRPWRDLGEPETSTLILQAGKPRLKVTGTRTRTDVQTQRGMEWRAESLNSARSGFQPMCNSRKRPRRGTS